MNFEQLANEILKSIGGSKNVEKLTHCITRLRFNLCDESIVDDTKVKQISGVMGVVKQSGQYQIIIGNDVDKVYDCLVTKLDGKNEGIKQKKNVGIVNRVIDYISSILSPLIPPLAAAGMLKVILLILTLLNVLNAESDTYKVLDFISDSVFYFMPLIVAYSASVKFKCNSVMAIALAGVLLHPTFTSLIGQEGASLSIVGAPISIVKYNATVLPTLMMVWFMSYVEHFAEKVSPNVIKVFFKPLLVMLIVAPVTLVIIGPIGNTAGLLLANVFTYLLDKHGWLAVALLSSVYSLLVMVGMHRALTPIGLSLYNTLGYEPLMKAAALCSNFAQASSCVAVAIKTKNKELKQVASTAATTAFISGITEPAMYGVTLRLKRPLIACIISSGIAGVYAGITMVKAYAYATPGLFSFAMFMGPDGMNIIHALIAALISIVGAFVLTLIFGFDDPLDDADKTNAQNENKLAHSSSSINVSSPVKGKVIQLSEVKDDTFASGVCGKGVAILPQHNLFVSPVDGILKVSFKTKHAFVFQSNDGVEILMHIGIDTVNLEGKYFEVLAKENTTVKKGDPIVKIDYEEIQKAGYDLTTCIIVTNSKDYLEVIETDELEVNSGDKIITLLEDKI